MQSFLRLKTETIKTVPGIWFFVSCFLGETELFDAIVQ
jgi:hypothetical protein